MSRFLAYVDAVLGRLYPLVPTLQELSRRGHHVTVKAGVDDIDRLRSAGLHAASLAPPIERFEPDDWKASTRFGGAGGPTAAADALEQLAPAHPGAAHESPGRGR